MKIGLLTLPLHTNIGGVLQAYALQKKLQDLGNSVVMLAPKQTLFFKIKRLIKRIVRKNEIITIDRIETNSFIQEHFPLWYYFCKKNDGNVSSFDALIVGSDQVWRSFGAKWDILQYFFDFVKKTSVKKIAYAASFGVNRWMFSDKMTGHIKENISLFSKVSVRENDGVQLCKKKLGVDAEWLLDPTMLLEKSDYEKLIGCESAENMGLVCYFIGENEKNNDFLRESLEKTICCFDGKCIMANTQGPKKKILRLIENWLYNMMNASFVITNSFHGVAFSINFGKPFIVLDNKKGGTSRIDSILSMFNLEDRFVRNVDDIPNIINKKIDWENVLKIKFLRKNQSLDFLRNI